MGLLDRVNQAILKAQLVQVDQDLLADLAIQKPQGFPVGPDHHAVPDFLVVQEVPVVQKLQACRGHQILPVVHEDQMVLEVLDCLESLMVQRDQLVLVDPEVQQNQFHRSVQFVLVVRVLQDFQEIPTDRQVQLVRLVLLDREHQATLVLLERGLQGHLLVRQVLDHL